MATPEDFPIPQPEDGVPIEHSEELRRLAASLDRLVAAGLVARTTHSTLDELKEYLQGYDAFGPIRKLSALGAYHLTVEGWHLLQVQADRLAWFHRVQCMDRIPVTPWTAIMTAPSLESLVQFLGDRIPHLLDSVESCDSSATCGSCCGGPTAIFCEPQPVERLLSGWPGHVHSGWMSVVHGLNQKIARRRGALFDTSIPIDHRSKMSQAIAAISQRIPLCKARYLAALFQLRYFPLPANDFVELFSWEETVSLFLEGTDPREVCKELLAARLVETVDEAHPAQMVPANCGEIDRVLRLFHQQAIPGDLQLTASGHDLVKHVLETFWNPLQPFTFLLEPTDDSVGLIVSEKHRLADATCYGVNELSGRFASSVTPLCIRSNACDRHGERVHVAVLH